MNDNATLGERRQVTVMFCDLVDSTGISARQDPEDLGEILNLYRNACTRVIGEFDGHLARVVGDGLLVFFGHPVAHEDDALLSVRAGLGILDVLQSLNPSVQRRFDERLAVRIGIHTGLVVTETADGSPGASGSMVIGHTPNIAARLQQFADPDSVIVSGDTRRLLPAHVAVESAGPPLSLKGFADPVEAFRVLRTQDPEAGPAREGRSWATSLIGRDEEIGVLRQCWEKALAGEGQVVVLIGEPGIGKSRLAEALVGAVSADGHSTYTYYCSERHQNVAFHPVIDRLDRGFGVRASSSDEEKRRGIEAMLGNLGPEEKDVWEHLARLVAAPGEHGAGADGVEPQELKRRMREAIIRSVASVARQGPVLVVAEDIHWMDPSSKELLAAFIDMVLTSALPILLMMTTRTEPVVAELGKPEIRRLALNRLSPEACRSLCATLASAAALPDETLEQISERSDGVPLFIEELTSTVLDTGQLPPREPEDSRLPRLARSGVPASLHGSIMARLDHLGPTKEVAQLAAAQGRTFDTRVLAAASGFDGPALNAALERLTEAGLIVPFAEGDGHRYEFRHALVADVAYHSLLRSRRRDVHGRIASALTTVFPNIETAEPDLVAQHHAEAGDAQAAFASWMRAGKNSVIASANEEALAQFRNARDQLQLLPESPERRRREMDLAVSMLGPAIATYGYGAAEVAQLIDSASALAQEVDNPYRFPILYSRWSYNQFTGRTLEAQKLAARFLEAAERQQDAAPLVVAHRLVGTSLLLTGSPAPAKEHLERSVSLYRSDVHAALTYIYGTDIEVMSLCYLAFAEWLTGGVDRAPQVGASAIEHARRLKHSNTIGYAMTHVALLSAVRGDPARVGEIAGELLELATRLELPFWQANARMFQGWLLTRTGKPEQGVALLEQVLERLKPLNLVYSRPTYLGWIAEAYLAMGDWRTALERLAPAEAIIEQGGERWAATEFWRLRAEIQRAADATPSDACLAHHRKAVAIAREQGATSFELRAAVGLGRRYLELGRGADARVLIEEALEPFRESMPDGDQHDAASVLEQIGGGSGA